jgi:hypothetical protein
MAVMDIIIIPRVNIPLVLPAMVEALHRLLEVNLGILNQLALELLVKAEMLLVILVVEEAAAGMAAVVPMIMTQTLMVVGGVVALAMYILHQPLLIIHPAVYLIRLII